MKKESVIAAPDAEVLKYAGAMGHEYVLVASRQGSGGSIIRHAACELNTLKSAVSYATGEYANKSPIVYRQIKPGEWVAVRLPR